MRAYLRAAQAYMLISIPTVTSTILGAFQAIRALLLKVFPSTVSRRLLRKEKFGEIFFEPKIEVICCDAEVGLGRGVADRASKYLEIKGVHQRGGTDLGLGQ